MSELLLIPANEVPVAKLYTAVLESPPFDDPRLVMVEGDRLDDPRHRFFARLVRLLRPRFVVELGTGRGRTAAQIAAALHEFSFFVTINWPNPPSGDDVGVELAPWHGSNRVIQVLSDTRDAAWRLPNNVVDLLYIDSTHTYECVRAEWMLYYVKLIDGAIVVLDDLDHDDMMRFWQELPYEKILIHGGRVGMFRYRKEVNR